MPELNRKPLREMLKIFKELEARLNLVDCADDAIGTEAKAFAFDKFKLANEYILSSDSACAERNKESNFAQYEAAAELKSNNVERVNVELTKLLNAVTVLSDAIKAYTFEEDITNKVQANVLKALESEIIYITAIINNIGVKG